MQDLTPYTGIHGPQARHVPQPRPVEIAERSAPTLSHALAFVTADETQIAARHYYRLGLNVFALERGEKETHYKWGILKTTRLVDPDALHPTTPALYSEMFNLAFRDANIAIITGATSRNLTVLDCENAHSAELHRKEFERRGLHPWIVRTARGMHFWLLSQDGTLQNIDPKEHAGQWELRAHDKYVIAPPSVHPTGAIYEFVAHAGDLPPSIPIAALDWLGVKLLHTPRAKFTPRENDPGPLAQLSKPNREFCENGASKGERNGRLTAAARDFAGNHIDQETARTFLLQGCAKCTPPYPRREAERVIDDAYSKPRTAAKQFYNSTNKAHSEPVYRRVRDFIDVHQWKPLHATYNSRRIQVSADTARKVLEACTERARMDDVRDAQKPFSAASREIAEIADIDRRTASKALAALAENGYLIAETRNEYGANRYTFGKKPRAHVEKTQNAHKCTSTYVQCFVTGTFVRAHSFRDVFTRGGLSNSAGRVWRLVLEKPRTVKQIAKRANMQPPTVRRALAKLAQNDLARRVGKGYWIGENADADKLNAIAKTRGTLGKTAKRKARHVLERQVNATERLLASRFRKQWARQLKAWGAAQ